MTVLRRILAVIFVLIAVFLVYVDIDVIFNHGENERVRWAVVVAYAIIAVVLLFAARALWRVRRAPAAPAGEAPPRDAPPAER